MAGCVKALSYSSNVLGCVLLPIRCNSVEYRRRDVVCFVVILVPITAELPGCRLRICKGVGRERFDWGIFYVRIVSYLQVRALRSRRHRP